MSIGSHMKQIVIALFFTLHIFVLSTTTSYAERLVYFPHYDGGGERFKFQKDVLRLALDKSGLSYKLALSPHKNITQSRAERLLMDRDSLDIMWGANDSAREHVLQIIPIPIDYGLLGLRINMIRARDQNKFNKVRRLNELKVFNTIQVEEWVDTAILRDADLTVTTGPYKSLPKMLMLGRGDLIPRSVREIDYEYNKWSLQHDQLAIDQNILLQYRQGDFFYINRADEELYNALYAGLTKIYEDGSLRNYINNNIKIDGQPLWANIKDRIIIKLDNPYASNTIWAIPDHYFEFYNEQHF